MTNKNNIDLINAAFTALMDPYKFISVKEFRDIEARHETNYEARYEEVDIKSFHQINLVGNYLDAVSNYQHSDSHKLQQIFVKICNKTRLILCEKNDTIDTIKLKIYAKKGIPPHEQRLIFTGKQLEGNKKLSDYGIQEG
ncbi:3937_t:CDS:1, partial [Dentiscutata erythropus]